MGRLALLALALAAASGCTRACKDGTLLVTVELGGATAADSIAVDVTVGTGAAMHQVLGGANGAASGTIEVDFSSYPEGSTVTVKVTASRGGQPLGSASGMVVLGAGCGNLELNLGGADLGGPRDLSGADLIGADLAGADLSMPDLANTVDLAGADLTPACGNGIVERTEACDDGNGVSGDGCDSTCAIEAGTHSDFDVAADHSIVAIRVEPDGSAVSAKCWDGNGKVRVDWFKIYSGAASSVESGHETVVVSRGGQALVTFLQLNTPGDFNTRLPVSKLLDRTCAGTTDVLWPVAQSGNYVFDTAIDAKSNLALLYQVPAGGEADLLAGPVNGMSKLVVDTTGSCTGNYALHVAFNETTGEGVVSCQQHQAMPIKFRRFTAGGAWADPQMVVIAETQMNDSSWYESHQIGVNDAGQFAVEWENAGNKTWEVDLFDATGTLQQHVVLGGISGAQYWDGFRYPHQHVAVDQGANFILRSDDAPGMFWRETPAGVLLGQTGPGTWSKLHLRTAGTADHWIDDATRIARNPLTL